jgi:hypothetical protein
MRYAILAVAILAGCSTQEKQVVLETTPPVIYNPVIIDEQCAVIAKYSRAIGLYKNIGIQVENIKFLIKVDVDFPLEALSRRVFSNDDADPTNETYVTYSNCVEETYDRFIDRLQRENAIYKLQEIEQMKTEAAKLIPKVEEKTTKPTKKQPIKSSKKK